MVPTRKQVSLRLARLRGPIWASKLIETRDWMEAKNEARSGSLSGLKGTVGSGEARDLGILSWRKAISLAQCQSLSELYSATTLNEDTGDSPSICGHRELCIVASTSTRRTYQNTRSHPLRGHSSYGEAVSSPKGFLEVTKYARRPEYYFYPSHRNAVAKNRRKSS